MTTPTAAQKAYLRRLLDGPDALTGSGEVRFNLRQAGWVKLVPHATRQHVLIYQLTDSGRHAIEAGRRCQCDPCQDGDRCDAHEG